MSVLIAEIKRLKHKYTNFQPDRGTSGESWIEHQKQQKEPSDRN